MNICCLCTWIKVLSQILFISESNAMFFQRTFVNIQTQEAFRFWYDHYFNRGRLRLSLNYYFKIWIQLGRLMFPLATCSLVKKLYFIEFEIMIPQNVYQGRIRGFYIVYNVVRCRKNYVSVLPEISILNRKFLLLLGKKKFIFSFPTNKF